MAIQLCKNTKAKDVVEKFCEASSKNKVTRTPKNQENENIDDRDNCCTKGNYFLHEVGGNIGTLRDALHSRDHDSTIILEDPLHAITSTFSD